MGHQRLRLKLRSRPKEEGSAVRKASQAFIDMQANIKQARVHLYALSKLVADWREFNEAATTHLVSAAKWERNRKVEEVASPR
jgi:hypothetical protein